MQFQLKIKVPHRAQLIIMLSRCLDFSLPTFLRIKNLGSLSCSSEKDTTKYFSLLKKVKHEEEENEIEQERLQGSAVVYGDKIQVYHDHSLNYKY